MEMTACIPDLSPIEYDWGTLEQRIGITVRPMHPLPFLDLEIPFL